MTDESLFKVILAGFFSTIITMYLLKIPINSQSV